MSFEDGMKLFKAGNYEDAAYKFLEVTEQDDQNHKAWNALAICLSKTGQYEAAHTCFENALALDENNAAYKRSYEKNNKKRGIIEEDLELDEEPVVYTPRVKPSNGMPFEMPPIKVAFGIIAVFFVLMMMGACVAGIGSGGKVSPSQPGSTSDGNTIKGFTVSDVKFDTSDYGAKVVSGIVKNTNNRSYKYVAVEINLYDSSGILVGSTISNMNNMDIGGIWKFNAGVLHKDAASFKVKDITAF